jgi:G3E family GTPase
LFSNKDKDLENKSINTYIITGFLGTGKTTTLNILLDFFKDQKNVVIENEFGKVNIDANLVVKYYDSINNLTNGCICCSKDEEMLNILSEIAFVGKNRPDQVFVECTGIANVSNVSSIFKIGDLPEVYNLKGIICVIDCESFFEYIHHAIEVSLQIVGSDFILLNKSEKMEAEKLAKLKDTLLSINSEIKFIHPHELTKELIESSVHATLSDDFSKIVAEENPHKINTKLYETSEKFNIENLHQILRNIQYFYNDTIFRIKGFVFDFDMNLFEIQLSSGNIKIKPVSIQAVEKSQLVFIGQELQQSTIDRLMRSCHTKVNTAFN